MIKKIEETHKRNFELIRKHKLIVGDKLVLIKPCHYLNINDKFTIKHIHNLYGWITFEETGQLPQEAEEIFKIMMLKKEWLKKYSLGCGKKFKRFNDNKQREVLNNPNFICGIPDGWGKETLCQVCDFDLRLKWKREGLGKK